jgi:triphosphoribosyl-dephospho-CoA synthetase
MALTWLKAFMSSRLQNFLSWWKNVLRWRRPNHTIPIVTRTQQTSANTVTPVPTQGVTSTPLGRRVDNLEDLTRAVLYVTFVTLIGVIVSLGSVLLDQWRFNQQTYKEASQDAQEVITNLDTEVSNLKEKVKDLNGQLEQKTLSDQ